MKPKIAVAVLLLFMGDTEARSEYRTWVGNNGDTRYAELVEVSPDGEVAGFRTSKGEIFRTHVVNLVPADRQRVQTQFMQRTEVILQSTESKKGTREGEYGGVLTAKQRAILELEAAGMDVGRMQAFMNRYGKRLENIERYQSLKELPPFSRAERNEVAFWGLDPDILWTNLDRAARAKMAEGRNLRGPATGRHRRSIGEITVGVLAKWIIFGIIGGLVAAGVALARWLGRRRVENRKA